MTESELSQLLERLDTLSPEQMQRLRCAIDTRLASRTRPSAGPPQGSLGAMRDAADELDAIVEQAMRNRQERPWRLPPSE